MAEPEELYDLPKTTAEVASEPEAVPALTEVEQDESASFHLVPYRPPSGGSLYVGSIPEEHRTFDITHTKAVVNLSGLQYKFQLDESIKLHNIPIGDHGDRPSNARVAAGIKFIDEHLDRGETVFIHCKLGQSRSVWFLLNYLRTKGVDIQTIWKELLVIRPGVKHMVVGFQADLGIIVSEGSKRLRKPPARLETVVPEPKKRTSTRGTGTRRGGKRPPTTNVADVEPRVPLAPKKPTRAKKPAVPEQTTTVARNENE
jgi:hypothetical protein